MAASAGDGDRVTMGELRIHVAGVSSNVKADDVEKTFSSLGRVSGVEFISRPDGRRFAYMDFEPNSEKSLAKLFATYCGCIWKGGRIKLEKAKEHYMDRLRREWLESSESQTNEQITKDDPKTLEKPNSMPQENTQTQLKIFFPKLNKVKPLAFKGTGKHKYSFQRVEIPPLPIHFCDCEEHCTPLAEISCKSFDYSTNQISAIGKKEINVMNSVMNKLFERETGDNAADEDISQVTEANILKHSDKDTKAYEMDEAEETDDDNFVMNFGSVDSNSMLDLFQTKGRGGTTGVQDGKKPTSTSRSIPNKVNSRKRQKTGTNIQLEITSEVEADTESKQKESCPVAPGKKRIPWKQLVGEAKISTFSVSQLLLGTTDSTKPVCSEPCDASTTKKAKKVSFQMDEDHSSMSSEVSDAPESGEEIDKLSDMETSNEDSGITNKSENDQDNAVGEKSNGNFKTSALEELLSIVDVKENPSDTIPQESQNKSNSFIDQHQTNENPTSIQSGRGSSWLQKSSWMQLVGGTTSTFSISQLVPDIDKLKPKTLKPCDVAASSKETKGTSHSNADSSSKHLKGNKAVHAEKSVDNSDNKETSIMASSVSSKSKNEHDVLGEKSDGTLSTDTGKVCVFMRNADSEMQWAKIRAAVRGKIKKNGKPDGSKGSKVWSKKRN